MIFFIYGTDHYRCQQKSQELKNQFIEKRDKTGLNVVQLDGERLHFEKFQQEALTTPFLSEKKMLVVKNAVQNKKLAGEIHDFLKDRSEKIDNAILFLELVDASQRWGISGSLFNYLKKQPYAWEMNLLNGWQLAEWLKKYLAEKNIKIEAGALKELLILTDNDLNNLVLELGKLIAYGDGQTIALTAVRELIKAKFNDDIFALVDALGQKNQKLAVKLISRQLKSGDHELAILNMVVRQFKIMLRVNSALENIEGRPNAAQIAETLNLHPFVVQKIMAQAQNFTPEKLVAIYRELIELEGKFKNGAKNPELLFDLFAVKNC